MLVSDVVRRVRESAGDIAVLQFSNSTVVDWINDGIRECVVENSLLQAQASTTTTIDQADYALPSDIFKIHSVWVDGYKLEMLTLEQWEERNAGSAGIETPTGEPFLCYVYAGLLTIWPTPDTEVSIVVNYTQLPAAVAYTEPGGTPTYTPDALSIPEAFHNRIVTYCMAQVALQDDDYNKYSLFMQEFKTGVIDLKHVKDQEDDLYPFLSVSSRDMGETWYDDHFIP